MTTTEPTVQARELDQVVAAAKTPEGRQQFTPRRSSGPVRASEMLDVPEGEEDQALVNKIDALEELLSLDPEREIRTEVDMTPGLQATYVVQAMSNELHQQLMEESTYYQENPRTHDQIRQLDNVEFTRLVVANCVVEPNLKDPRLFQKHRISLRKPDLLVAKLLLPGQIDRLAGAIMRLSGFRDDLVAVAKNSSKGTA